jgi:hypothetical protein
MVYALSHYDVALGAARCGARSQVAIHLHTLALGRADAVRVISHAGAQTAASDGKQLAQLILPTVTYVPENQRFFNPGQAGC